MQRFINLLDDGFIPLPRMERRLIDEETGLPADAISALVSFRHHFDAFAIVSGHARGESLDPILIGIIRSNRTEEHFLLGWWRPDLISPSQLW